MMKPKYIMACVFLVLLSSPALAQRVEAKKLTRLHLSEDLRVRLAERLNLFIEYELTKQYEKQYALLATKCPAAYTHMCAAIPEHEYVIDKRKEREIYGTLVELKFAGVNKELRDNCAFPILKPKFRKGKSVYANLSLAIACLQDGDWYFRFGLVEI